MKTDDITVKMNYLETKQSFGGYSYKVIGEVKGKKVMVKNGDNTEVIIEKFAYKLGKALGLRVNKVKVLVDQTRKLEIGKYCSVHYWEDKFKTMVSVDFPIDTEDITIVKFFDELLGNDDRHGRNYGLVNGKLFFIDNGLGQPWYAGFNQENVEDIIEFAKYKEKSKWILKRFLQLDVKSIEKMLRVPDGFDEPLELGKIKRINTRYEGIKTYIYRRLQEEGVVI